MFWTFMFSSIAAYLAGDYLSKVYIETRYLLSLFGLCGAYATSTCMWVFALRADPQLSTSGLIWAVLSVVGSYGLGTIFFKEPVTTTNVCGLVLALAAIALIAR